MEHARGTAGFGRCRSQWVKLSSRNYLRFQPDTGVQCNGRKAGIGMKIVKYIDSDEINKPQTGNAVVYTLQNTNTSKLTRDPITKEVLIKKYSEVFSDGVRKLAGEYHFRIDSAMEALQHAPRRVLVALKAKVQEALDNLEKQKIITPVTLPTAWISSMVTAPKKKGKLRTCLDPRDLNRAIQREHYPLATIEDIATRLHGAKVFKAI